MTTNDEKWLAEQLEQHAAGQEADLPAGLAHVSSSLQQSMRQIQPRPGFVNELEGQLGQQARGQQENGFAGRLRRLLSGAAGAVALAAGAVAVAAFVWFVVGLFSSPPLTASATPDAQAQATALPGAAPSPTALPAGLSLTAPGWIHTIEQVEEGSMATVDPESGDIVNLQTTFQIDAWSLLDEQGNVVRRVSQVRDLQGRLLQANTLRDGVSRNLTFQQQVSVQEPPLPLEWADPGSPLYDEATITLLLIERAPAPPADVLALLDQEITSNACAGLTLVDEAAWDVRERYNRWVDEMAAELGAPSGRWLSVRLAHRQNPDAVVHQGSPLPLDYHSEQWLQLDDMSRVVARVSIVSDGQGQAFSSGVQRDGVAYDFAQQQQNAYRPHRLDLDRGFFANMNSQLGPGGGLALAEAALDSRPALRYSFCHSYNGARPRFGELPQPIEGNQYHLWLDAASGQPLRAERSYADVRGQVHLDWSEMISIEVVDELPPQAQALWLQAAQTEVSVLNQTPALPAVPSSYPGITLTLQGATYEAYQTTVSFTVQLATDDVSRAYSVSQGRTLLFDDAGNQYQPSLGNAGSVRRPPGLVGEVSQSFEPGLADGARLLFTATTEGEQRLQLLDVERGERFWVDAPVGATPVAMSN